LQLRSQWFDVDSPDDGVESETLEAHMGIDRGLMQKCYNPLGIEVMVKATNELFVPSAIENADGNLVPTHNNVLQGFKCEDSIQTVDGLTCPDVKVRYKCLPGLGEMQGRIYTQVHGRSDHPEFHVNRIMETPVLKNDNDGFKSECQIFLNDGQNCGSHSGCGVNKRLNLKVVNGNDGLIQYVANAPVPGRVLINVQGRILPRYLFLANHRVFIRAFWGPMGSHCSQICSFSI